MIEDTRYRSPCWCFRVDWTTNEVEHSSFKASLFPLSLVLLEVTGTKGMYMQAEFDHRLELLQTGSSGKMRQASLESPRGFLFTIGEHPAKGCCQTVVWEVRASQRGCDWEGIGLLEPDNAVLSTVVAASIRRVSHVHRTQKLLIRVASQ